MSEPDRAPREGIVGYRIDAADVVVSVDEGFRAFARGNGAPDLPERVVGTALADWIEGPRVRHVYGALIDRARDAGVPLRVPFRCDAPGLRRAMSMEIRLLDGGAVEFRCEVEAAEARPRIAALDPAASRSGRSLAMCAWCKAIRIEGWMDLERAIGRLGAIDDDPPRFTHGICDACLARMDAVVR